MKILVSTKEKQGQRKNDFCFVPEGEIVVFGSECDGEAVDGKCGCRRSLVGVKCSTATTTFKVADIPTTEEELVTRLYESAEKGGWLQFYKTEDGKKRARTLMRKDARELIRVGSFFREGDVVERRGDKLQRRK